MTENKADPLREALEAARSEIVVAIAFLSRDTGTNRSVDTVRGIIDRLARADAAASAALAAQPAAPLGGRDEIARIIFGKACGLSRWDDAFYAEERHGCLETADAILAAIPQELGDVERLLQDTLAEYEQTVEVAEKDTALSDTGRQRVIECCLDARGAVKAFAARLLAQPPTANVVAGTDRAAIIEECAKVVDLWIKDFGSIQTKHLNARSYAVDAVADVAEAIRALAGKETDQ